MQLFLSSNCGCIRRGILTGIVHIQGKTGVLLAETAITRSLYITST